MSKKSRFVTALGIALLLVLIPASASANVGGAAPRIQSMSSDDELVKNVGGAGPKTSSEPGDGLVENVGGASPTLKNVGGAVPRGTDTLTENVGGASPRTWTTWLLDLLNLD